MTKTLPILPLIRRFLKLETLAHELYLAHLPHVPAFAKKDFREFIKTEERHRRIFERLYCRIGRVTRHPRFPFSVWMLKLVAQLIRLGGFKAICRFECAIERKAIADYEQALTVVRQSSVRSALKRVLEEEKDHPSLSVLLTKFLKDEEEHVERMETVLQKKISTVTR